MATPMKDDQPEAAASGATAGGEEDEENITSTVAAATAGAVPTADAADDDSDDSDNEMDGDAAADELQIQALERAIQENPLDYESRVQYVQCLRKSGQIEKLRAVREEMNMYFPLTPKMWQEWAKDEISLSTGDESFHEIEKLYERGVQEYLSVQLWCDYLDYVEEHDQSVAQCSPSGLSKMRDLFERALTAAGLHVTEGSKLWEAYREFEQAILLTIADSNNEEKVKQVQRIRALFRRQLSVPLVDLQSTLTEYKLWESEQGNANDINSNLDAVPSNVASAYEKATEMYNLRKEYEDQLSKPDASEVVKLDQFLNYIKFEESCGDPARVQILYERAISEFPVSSDLWMGYTSFLDKTLKVPTVAKSVYYRATRNCMWVSELWVRYLLSLERMHASEEELRHVFEQSVKCSFPSIKEYLNLYLTRVDGLRRRISYSGTEDGLDFQLIRQTFVDAVDLLSCQLGTDDLVHLHAYWARLECDLGKDHVAARGVWENLLKNSGSVLEVWQHYIAMEIQMGHIHEARSIYKRCYSKRFAGSGSEDLCHSWIRFEREYGTIDDYDLAVKKVTPRLKELMMFKTQQEPKADVPYSVIKDTHNAINSPMKRKPSQMSSKKQPPAKKKKDNIPKRMVSSDQRSKEKSENIANAVEVENIGSDTANVERVEVPAANKTLKESKANFYTDQCTAFISNINLAANEEHINDFFRDIGGVTAVRLLKDKFTGKSRGLAYVDFSDNEHLEAAIAKNKQKLLGKAVSIARSDPSKSKKGRDDGSSRGRDRVSSRSGRGEKAPGDNGSTKEKKQGDLTLTGKSTFAAPRSLVKPLGWNKHNERPGSGAEELKSNEEFRNVLLKK